MVKNAKKAFTLVELIVVITILAILGTIAFISLNGYSAQARDSKRLTDVNQATSKINIELVRGAQLNEMLTGAVSGLTAVTFTTTPVPENKQGIVNFAFLKENADNFKDPLKNLDRSYPFAYVKGGTGTGAYNYFQMATVDEEHNSAKVVWNYFDVDGSGSLYPTTLIESLKADNTASGGLVVEWGAILPYPLVK